MNSSELFDLLLRSSRGGVAAMRAVTKLQPVDGEGGKVFPPTYAEGAYAFETRRRNGQDVHTVLLDSVQSQANRFEEQLLGAYRSARLNIPVFEMSLPGHETLTSLTVLIVYTMPSCVIPCGRESRFANRKQGKN